MSGSELPGDRSVAIWWVRRDLRVSDNRALDAALWRSEQVVPLFIVDPLLMDQPAPLRKGFLWDGLRQLAAGLRVLGSRLIVRRGEPVDVLAQVVSETGAAAVFAEEDYAPYAQARDARAVARLPVHFVSGPTLRHTLDVLKVAGTPYTVFSPYSRAWSALAPPGADDLLPAPCCLPPVSDSLFSFEFADDIASDDFPAGEREARQRLESFTAGTSPPIWEYAHTRDRLDLPGTSTLSPYLRFGMLSARQAIVATRQAMDRAPDQGARLVQPRAERVDLAGILPCDPLSLSGRPGAGLPPTLRHVPWDNNRTAFDAWCAGETGYPVVDAAMRQLRQTGWMHNRARMIVASFLMKDLLIDWQWGERWFME